jgi:hypothetical protein
VSNQKIDVVPGARRGDAADAGRAGVVGAATNEMLENGGFG